MHPKRQHFCSTWKLMPEDNQSVWCNFQNTVKLMIINEVLHSK